MVQLPWRGAGGAVRIRALQKGRQEVGWQQVEAEIGEMVWGYLESVRLELGGTSTLYERIGRKWGECLEFSYCYEWDAFLVPFKAIAVGISIASQLSLKTASFSLRIQCLTIAGPVYVCYMS